MSQTIYHMAFHPSYDILKLDKCTCRVAETKKKGEVGDGEDKAFHPGNAE